jgi:hypothetical protein
MAAAKVLFLRVQRRRLDTWRYESHLFMHTESFLAKSILTGPRGVMYLYKVEDFRSKLLQDSVVYR